MRSETSYASGMDPLHASIEDFTAEGFTHIECHCPRCRMTRWGRSVGFHESRWDLPLHSYQHGSAEPSAAGSFTRSSRGDWKMCWASRWGGASDDLALGSDPKNLRRPPP